MCLVQLKCEIYTLIIIHIFQVQSNQFKTLTVEEVYLIAIERVHNRITKTAESNPSY